MKNEVQSYTTYLFIIRQHYSRALTYRWCAQCRAIYSCAAIEQALRLLCYWSDRGRLSKSYNAASLQIWYQMAEWKEVEDCESHLQELIG